MPEELENPFLSSLMKTSSDPKLNHLFKSISAPDDLFDPEKAMKDMVKMKSMAEVANHLSSYCSFADHVP